MSHKTKKCKPSVFYKYSRRFYHIMFHFTKIWYLLHPVLMRAPFQTGGQGFTPVIDSAHLKIDRGCTGSIMGSSSLRSGNGTKRHREESRAHRQQARKQVFLQAFSCQGIHDARLIRGVASSTRTVSTGSPAIKRNTILVATRPISNKGWWIVVKAGVTHSV